MKQIRNVVGALLLDANFCACGNVENKVAPSIPADPEIEANIQQWLGRMTLEEKIGQSRCVKSRLMS